MIQRKSKVENPREVEQTVQMGEFTTSQPGQSEEFKKFDKWCSDIITYFGQITDYQKIPQLPNSFPNGMDFYAKANEQERAKMMASLIGKYVEILRRWKVGTDAVYGRNQWNFFIN